MAEPRRLRELASSAADRLQLPEGRLAVALSGGADSAALAWLCVRAGRETRAVHVNHGLDASGTMESAARGIAARLGIGIDVRSVSVPDGASPEGQAREVRYRELAAARRPDESLLTAHTLDDNAETIVLNLVRGSGPRGLAGVPHVRPVGIYRPSLDLRRSELREIAALAGLPFVDDPMNQDLDLTRNWIRSEILPRLQEMNPRLARSLRRTGRILGRDVAYFERRALEHGLALGEGRAGQPRGVLLTAPEAIADRMLISMLHHVLGDRGVTGDRLERIWSVVRGETVRQELGDGAVAELEGPMLVIGLPRGAEQPSDQVLEPGIHAVGRLEFEVRSVAGPCRVLPLSRWAAVFPAGTELVARADGMVTADGEEAWVPGERRLPVAWYQPGAVGYLSVVAREGSGWTSSR